MGSNNTRVTWLLGLSPDSQGFLWTMLLRLVGGVGNNLIQSTVTPRKLRCIIERIIIIVITALLKRAIVQVQAGSIVSWRVGIIPA